MGHLGGIEYIKVFEEDLPEWAGKGDKDLDEDEAFFHNDFFLEVINKKGETIGLFFLLNRLYEKPDCRDGLEFARYYDQLIPENDDYYWLTEESYWEEAKKLLSLSDEGEIEDYEIERGYDPLFNSTYGRDITRALISYGRLKYPYGLEEPARQIYESTLKKMKIEDSIGAFCGETQSEIVDLLIELFGIDELYKRNYYWCISDLELDYYGDNADRLLTITNIEFFIEAANRNTKTDVLAFLLDYKNKHFPEKRNELPRLQG